MRNVRPDAPRTPPRRTLLRWRNLGLLGGLLLAGVAFQYGYWYWRLSTGARAPQVGEAAIDTTMVPEAPAGLRESADHWVATVNSTNAGLIQAHWVDKRGNLYVFLGAWPQVMGDTITANAVSRLAVAWRAHLRNLTGGWDSRSGFAPGIIVIDTAGVALADLNNTFRMYRLPGTPP